ncbi:hypothetical protein L484_003959 [Morus notabilis]|uniref:Uncharacterized protein n=1 Tax=Morus notabilis TaxID=981085 RepID=W9RRS2_9ROSA|nr:hypothetical protein L484_003959 [Morus notabilis]
MVQVRIRFSVPAFMSILFWEVTVIRNIENTRVDEREDNRVLAATCKETISRPTEAEGSINVLNTDESNDRVRPSSVKVPHMELFSDSQSSDSKNEAPSSPLEEIFVPSELVMNLQLDSAPPGDVKRHNLLQVKCGKQAGAFACLLDEDVKSSVGELWILMY